MAEFIIWVDVESSGLSPEQDSLLEIAACITDMKGNKQSSGFSSLIKIENLPEIINSASDEVRKMHDESGLWEELWNSKTSKPNVVDNEMFEWIQHSVKFNDVLYFGGNSITFDRLIMRNNLPITYNRIHHRSIDVTTLSLVTQNNSSTVGHVKSKEHRALSDVYDVIEEYKYYLNVLFKSVKENRK